MGSSRIESRPGGVTAARLHSGAAVTGLGAVSPAGVGVDSLWRCVTTAPAPMHAIEHFDAAAAATDVAGCVPGHEPEVVADDDLGRLGRLARLAFDEAVGGADGVGAQAAVVLGTTFTGGDTYASRAAISTRPRSPSSRVRWRRLPPSASTSGTLSASGATAIGVGLDLLRWTEAKTCVAGGADVVTRASYYGLNALRTLHPGGCRPFSSARRGIQLSEGAAFLVLEDTDHLDQVSPLAFLLGYGESNRSSSVARPDPEGIADALRRALADAALEPSDIDYVNAHGPGTKQGDAAEVAALERGVRPAHLRRADQQHQAGHPPLPGRGGGDRGGLRRARSGAPDRAADARTP